MSPEEMHQMEKAALDDPFLADAIDGYRLNPEVNIAVDIRELRERLSEKTKSSGKTAFGWWRIAALLILVLGASLATWYLSIPATDNTTLAKNEELRPSGAADTLTNVIPGLNIIDTTLTNNRNPASSAASENTGPVKEKSGDQGRNISKTADQPVAAVEESDKKDLSVATVDKPVPGKLTAEKADQSRIAALSKESEIAASGTKSKAAPPVAMQEKNADARRVEPAKSEDEKPSNAGKAPLSAPTYYFKGRVTDEHNRPIPYASVRISNSSKGTYTDVQGRFSMVSSDNVLHTDIQSVGFTSKKITLQAAPDPALIRLESSPSSLSEVVISSGRSKEKKVADETDSSEEKNTLPFAEPSDGWSLYEIYIKNNLRIPVTPGEAPLRGAVTVSFYVDPDKGRLSDFRIEKSIGILHDKEAIRVLKDGPPWDVYNTDNRVRTSFTIVF